MLLEFDWTANVGGEVEIDGAYFGGYVKPANFKENRRDHRLLEPDPQAPRRGRDAGAPGPDIAIRVQVER